MATIANKEINPDAVEELSSFATNDESIYHRELRIAEKIANRRLKKGIDETRELVYWINETRRIVTEYRSDKELSKAGYVPKYLNIATIRATAKELSELYEEDIKRISSKLIDGVKELPLKELL